MPQLGCSESEYRNRVSAVQAVMKEKGLDAFIFWNGTSAFYLPLKWMRRRRGAWAPSCARHGRCL